MSFLTDETLFAGTISDSDLIHLVDVSDTKQNAAGSSYKLTIGQLKTAIPTIYSADGTLSGARTITQAGYALNFVGGNVGIGVTTSDTDTRLHIQGVDATNSNYAIKIKNSASDNLLSIQNNGRFVFGTFGNNTASYLFNLSDTGQNGSDFIIKGIQHSAYFRIKVDSTNDLLTVSRGFKTVSTGQAVITGASDFYSGLIIQAKANSTSYIELTDNTDEVIFNSSLMKMENIPNSNAGLTTGQIYFASAATVLANGDDVLARKA